MVYGTTIWQNIRLRIKGQRLIINTLAIYMNIFLLGGGKQWWWWPSIFTFPTINTTLLTWTLIITTYYINQIALTDSPRFFKTTRRTTVKLSTWILVGTANKQFGTILLLTSKKPLKTNFPNKSEDLMELSTWVHTRVYYFS